MAPPDLDDLLRLYARRGIADWRAAPQELRQRAKNCLGTAIADNDAEATRTIITYYNDKNNNQLKFIPMPKHPKGHIERCFFLPVRSKAEGEGHKVAYELFLLVENKNCLAFRFEPADPEPSVHGYGHVQMSRKMLRKTIDVKGVPTWLPSSYPAFPISTSDPLRMFLAMAAAVHGYVGGISTVLVEIFQTANRSGGARAYLEELKKTLG